MSTDAFDQIARIVQQGHLDGAYPAAVAEVGTSAGLVWRQAFGRFDYDADAPITRPDTIFDLASLTKVITTTSVAMRLVDATRLSLDDAIGRWLPNWRGRDREQVTVRALLSHSSGLTAWLPFYQDCKGRTEFQHAICSLPLEYEPDSQSIYSDLGFILLAFILEESGAARFGQQTADLLKGITTRPLLFNPPSVMKSTIAPTEFDPWRGRRLVGDVHDENAWALGGEAGHAGLFGTAEAVGDFARAMLATLGGRDAGLGGASTARMFVSRYAGIPGSRALGWDTMMPTSSCGSKMSPSAFGHTGFTGTSLWVDPEADVYVVLLTNRVNPTRTNNRIQTVRPAVHDAVMNVMEAMRRVG